MKGLRAERWGKAILSVSLPPLFLSQGWESCASHSAPHLSSIYLFFPSLFLSPPTLSIISLPSHLFPPLIHPSSPSLSHFLTSASFPVFIHPALSLLAPPSLIVHPSPHHFSPLISPIHLPPSTRTHTINCRLVKQTNRHNSPDKRIEALITSVLHEELKILQKKDVPPPL